jgi:hypothetical protein
MKKEKLTLQELQVQSLVTTLNDDQMGQLKGGFTIVKGRRFNFRTRWTSVDVRGEIAEMPVSGFQQVG